VIRASFAERSRRSRGRGAAARRGREKEDRVMTNPKRRSRSIRSLAVLPAALAAACVGAESEGEKVTLTELSAPARAAVEKLVAGGEIEKIHREVEKGKTIYDVEATVGGKHVEYTIAESDGAVLGTESPIAWGELPAAVRSAAEKHFGGPEGLTAWKCVEGGITTYEIEGRRNEKHVELELDAEGTEID
jgi:uncharacterized membrane protein YkoI